MSDLMDKALARVRGWTDENRMAAAEFLLALDELGDAPIDVSDDELFAIDEGLVQAARNEFADPADVEAVFARYRAGGTWRTVPMPTNRMWWRSGRAL